MNRTPLPRPRRARRRPARGLAAFAVLAVFALCASARAEVIAEVREALSSGQLETAQNSYVAQSKAYVNVETQLFPNVEVSFGKGLMFRSPVRSVPGRQAIYVEDRLVVTQPSLPRFFQSENE